MKENRNTDTGMEGIKEGINFNFIGLLLWLLFFWKMWNWKLIHLIVIGTGRIFFSYLKHYFVRGTIATSFNATWRSY